MSVTLSTPPKLSELSLAIGELLTEWVAERGGGPAKQLANMRHLWEEVSNPALVNDRPRVLFCFTGQAARGGFSRANLMHRCDNSWQVVVVRGHGWANLVSEGGTDQTEAFLDAMESLRETLRCFGDITAEPPIDFKSMGPLPNVAPGNAANIFADAFQITFSTANDIPGIDFTGS